MNYENKAIVKGMFHSMDLIEFVSRKGDNYVRGSVVVEVDETNLIPVQFIAKQGSKVEQGIRTLASENKNIAEHGRENADFIEVKLGKIEENSFVPKGTQVLVEAFNVQAPFFSKVAKSEPAAEFQVEGVIMSVLDEVVNDTPTGNVVIRLNHPGYLNKSNVIAFTVPADKPDAISYCKNNFVKGQWTTLKGEIKILEEVKEKTVKSAFGEDLVSYTKIFTRKLMVNSATPPIECRIPEADLNRSLAEREGNVKEMMKRAIETKPAEATKPSASNFSL